MTEAEWFTCVNPIPMLEFLGARAGERKCRLFACACCRRHWHRVQGTPAAKAVEVVERYADGQASDNRLTAAWRFAGRTADQFYEQFRETNEVAADVVHIHASACGAATKLVKSDHPPSDIARQAVTYATMAYAHEMVGDVALYYGGDWERFQAAEFALHTATLRDVFGNPFRRVEFKAEWRTSDVVPLAQGIYKEHAFDRMPILADALQDAGCAAEPLLSHLRDPNATHVRGCWALDLVLGKE